MRFAGAEAPAVRGTGRPPQPGAGRARELCGYRALAVEDSHR
ncbi:hypothetical protein [Streptomyces sp. NPDC001635]